VLFCSVGIALVSQGVCVCCRVYVAWPSSECECRVVLVVHVYGIVLTCMWVLVGNMV